MGVSHAGSSRGCFHSWLGANESLGIGTCIGRAASSLNQFSTGGVPSVLISPSPEALDVTVSFLHTPDLTWVLFFPGHVAWGSQHHDTNTARLENVSYQGDRQGLQHKYALAMESMGIVPSPSDTQQIPFPPLLHQGLNGTTGSHHSW